MITRLRLKNWKSHIDSEFSFSEGVNALIGIMGSGKSSITQAMCFALFGTCPALQSRRITLEDLIMKKPDRKSGCEVELGFVFGGKEYTIKRAVESGKGTTFAEISEGVRQIDEGPHAVTRAVESMLQMDYDLFSRAVYSEQNSLDYFLRMPKGSRMQQIDGMLKVDRFGKVRAEATALANRVKQKQEEKLRLIADLEKERLDERMRELNKEIELFQKEREALRKDIETVRKEKRELEKRLEGIEGREKELNKAKQELEGIKRGMSEITQTIEDKRKRLEEHGDIAEKTRQLKKVTAALKMEVDSAYSGLQEIRNEKASVQKEISIINDSIKELRGVGAKCHVCDSPVTDERKESIIAGRQSKKKGLENRLAELETGEKMQNGRREHIEKQHAEKQQGLAKVEALSDEARALEEMKARKQAYLKHEYVLADKVKRLEAALAETDIKALRIDMQGIAARESEATTKLGSIDERIKDKQDIVGDIRERQGLMDKYRKEVERDSKITESLNSFVKVLRMTQEQLREEFLKTVNTIMAELWPELYPYGDFSSVRMAIQEGDYVLQLREAIAGDEESWISVDGIASGGERSMACLALRIAFSKAFIPNLKWLILDEPTHNLDSNAIEQFSHILREKIAQVVDQVFLITHEERISEAVGGSSGSLYRLERDKEANEPTRIKTI